MITAKAFLALTLTALGGAAAGTVLYLQTHPPVSPAAPPLLPEPAMERAAYRPPVQLAVPEPEIRLEPVLIEAPLPPRKRAPAAIPKRKPAAEIAPEGATIVCSDWRELESGPENHRVRSLCVPPAAP